MKLIALVGMTGAGKSELAKLFEKGRFTKIRFGDITEELLKKQGLDVNEENEKRIRDLEEKIKNSKPGTTLPLKKKPEIKNSFAKGPSPVSSAAEWF